MTKKKKKIHDRKKEEKKFRINERSRKFKKKEREKIGLLWNIKWEN